MDGLPFKVIPKGEVAKHLKVGAVAGSVTDVFDVAGADALLAGGHPVTGGLLLSGKVGLHGGHARVDKKQGSVSLRNEGEAGQTKMLFAFKKLQVHFTQLVDAKGVRIFHW